jgi:hypothetical protein
MYLHHRSHFWSFQMFACILSSLVSVGVFAFLSTGIRRYLVKKRLKILIEECERACTDGGFLQYEISEWSINQKIPEQYVFRLNLGMHFFKLALESLNSAKQDQHYFWVESRLQDLTCAKVNLLTAIRLLTDLKNDLILIKW